MKLRVLWMLPLMSFLLCSGLLAQDTRGSITGRVTDTSGAVMPDVAVTVTNLATNVTATAKTNAVGLFEFSFLSPSTYRLAAEAAGFKSIVRDRLELRTRESLNLPLTMEVGASADKITITAETPLLETTSASVGQVIDQRRMADLPIAHGNPFLLMSLSAGAVFTGNAGWERPYEPGAVGYALGGAAGLKSEVSMDGSPDTMVSRSAGSMSAGYTPPADIVQEMKVESNSFDASTGHTQGGATTVLLKSGTNQLHGTAYYSMLRPSLSANLFFANKAGQPIGPFTYSRWGDSLSGPVYLPKVYNGKDRTFFSYAYEGIHESRAVGAAYGEGTLTVPTEAQRQGDFSALLKLGSNYQIYDPMTRRTIAGGRTQVDPIPGNVIAPSRIDPVAKNILSYYSLPNAAGTADGFNNLIRVNDSEVISYLNHVFKVDHNFSSRHRAFLRGSTYKRLTSNNRDWFRSAASGQMALWWPKGVAFDDVFFLTPSTFLNVRYSLYALQIVQGPTDASKNFDLASLGFPKGYVDAIPYDVRRFPGISIANYTGTQDNWYDYNHQSHTIEANLTMVRGKHSLKIGTDDHNYRGNMPNWGNVSTGAFTFATDFTRGPYDNAAPAPIGQGLASMLLGLPTAGSVLRNTAFAQQSTLWAFFFQDSYRVTSKLTLNLGLRYELEGPMTERYNRSARGYDFSTPNPLDAQVRANYAANPIPELDPSSLRLVGGLTFAGVNGQPRTLWSRDVNNLMPRAGLAYALNNKTVLRAGYGVYFGFLGVQRGDVNLTGFQQTTTLVPSIDSGLTFRATLSNPFPDGILEPRGAADGVMTFAGKAIKYYTENPAAQRFQRWQFGVQRELPKRIVMEAAYVGGYGDSLERSVPMRSLPLQYYSTLPVRDLANNNYLTGQVSSPFYPLLPGTNLSSAKIARSYLLQSAPQYSQFNGVTTTVNDGYSTYHALSVRAERRFADSFTLNGVYTWSKNMQATSRLNGEFSPLEYVISSEDRPHRVVISGIWELPFGRGKRFFSASRLADKFVGGWQFQGIYTGQAGPALGFGDVFFNGNIHDITLPEGQRTVERWFNVDAGFVRASGDQPVSHYRTMPSRLNDLRADGMNQWDLSVIKNTTFSERLKAQLRGEFLNALNHANFGSPNMSAASSSFGVVTSQLGYPRRIQVVLKFLF